jgi:hypothetical protein
MPRTVVGAVAGEKRRVPRQNQDDDMMLLKQIHSPLLQSSQLRSKISRMKVQEESYLLQQDFGD